MSLELKSAVNETNTAMAGDSAIDHKNEDAEVTDTNPSPINEENPRETSADVTSKQQKVLSDNKEEMMSKTPVQNSSKTKSVLVSKKRRSTSIDALPDVDGSNTSRRESRSSDKDLSTRGNAVTSPVLLNPDKSSDTVTNASDKSVDPLPVTVKDSSAKKIRKKSIALNASDNGSVDSPGKLRSSPRPSLDSTPKQVKKLSNLGKKNKTPLIVSDAGGPTSTSESPVESTPGSTKGRKRKSTAAAMNEEPLFADDRLPEGWSRSLIQRQLGATAGKYDVYIISPQQKKFRSQNELRNFFIKTKSDLIADDFDFSVFGKPLKKSDGTTSMATPGSKQTTPAGTTKTTPTDSKTTPTVLKTTTNRPSKNGLSAKTGLKRKLPSEKKAESTDKAKRIRLSTPRKNRESDDMQCISPYFIVDTSLVDKAGPIKRTQSLVGQKWTPPRSPYKLIQETLHHDPWQLLVATILLNKTAGKTATPIIYELLKQYPTPESLGSVKEIAELIKPLGLHDKRARTIKKFSDEFVNCKWTYPNELFGIGKYGNDSYRMFCVDEWRAVNPSDHMLLMYKNWMVANWREICKNTNNCRGLPT